MKKILIYITIFFLLAINFLTYPIEKVSAETNIIDDETAYAIGSIVTASQGGEIQNNENFYARMNQLGNNIVQNAVQNGKRITDIIQRNGNDLLFNPSSIIDVIGNTWEDFANNELTWMTNERYIIQTGANFYMGPGIEPRIATINWYANEIPFIPSRMEIYGNNLTAPNLAIRRIAHQGSSNGTIIQRAGFTYSSGSVASHNNVWGIQIENIGNSMTSHASINQVIVTTYNVPAGGTTHIPYNEIPPRETTINNFRNTYRETFDIETNEIINNNNWYSYNLEEITNHQTIINNQYITNNHTIINNEGDTTIHQPDESGGGTFWTALLELLGNVILGLTNLGSSIVNAVGRIAAPIVEAIGNIVQSLLDGLISLIIPEDLDISGRFSEINDKFQTKFSFVFDLTGSFTSVFSQPKHINEIDIKIMDQQLSLFTPSMMNYVRILRTIITGYICLLTLTTIYNRFVGKGDILE